MSREVVPKEKNKLPDGWKWKKLSDVVENWKEDIVSGPFGSNLVVADYQESGIPLIRLQNIQRRKFLNEYIKYVSVEKAQELKRHSYIPGDIVIAKLGIPIGKTCIVPEEIGGGIIVADVVRVRVNQKENDVQFIEYALNSDIITKQLTNQIIGSTRPRVNLNHVRNVLFPIPKLSVQKKIVSKLDKQMTQIEMMKKESEKQLEVGMNFADSILKDIFQNGKKPSWKTETLQDVCIINPRKQKLNYSDNMEITFVPMESVNAKKAVIDNPKIKSFGETKKGYTYFEENDVLFAKITPCMQNKKSAIARNLKNEFGFGTTEWHVIRCKEKILPEWILQFIRQREFIENAKVHFTGAVGQQRVPKTFLEKYQISYPSLDVQKKLIGRLSEKLKINYKIIESIKTKINAINQLHSSILNEVFGQYEIPKEVET